MKQTFSRALLAALSLFASAAAAGDNRFPYQGRLENAGTQSGNGELASIVVYALGGKTSERLDAQVSVFALKN